MPLSITTNPAAGTAARALELANGKLTDSLKRLSTGKRIANPYDDAGGEAVQLKMGAAITRYGTTKKNLQNAISYLQVQDGVLTSAVSIVSRMADLRTMADDVSKSSEDLDNYFQEFDVLRTQLVNLNSEEFNGSAIFGTGANRTVYTSEQGSAGPQVNFFNNGGAGASITGGVYALASTGEVAAVTNGNSFVATFTTTDFTSDLQTLANFRAQNGAYQSVMNFAYDNASIGKTNLEAARSRIADVDIAEESGAFASNQILAQAASSMLAQANNINRSTLLTLLG
jgi:flagellin